MDPHLSSSPTPAPLGHMPPYYRRHNYYLIAIKHKKNQIEIIYPRGKSAAHKTCSFLPIPYTWGLKRRPRRWAPRPNHLTKWPQTRWCTTRDLALSIKKNPNPNGLFLRYDVLRTKKSVTNGRTDGRTPLFDPPPNASKWTGWSMKRFATREVDGVYSREASGIRCLPGGGPAGRAWRGLFVSDDGVN
jgi:hypothetical protein